MILCLKKNRAIIEGLQGIKMTGETPEVHSKKRRRKGKRRKRRTRRKKRKKRKIMEHHGTSWIIMDHYGIEN